MKTKFKYIGKEKDVETAMNVNFEGSLADHGVRNYEDYTGRFTTPEPLWEKYYQWSPYVYSANNPMIFVDENGKNYGFAIIGKGIDSHTRLFFQGANSSWYQYDQGASEVPIKSSGDFSHTLNIDVPGSVTIKSISENEIPENTIMYKTSKTQDASIEVTANNQIMLYQYGILKSNLYSNNCTDDAVNVIEKALNIKLFNPWYLVMPSDWFDELTAQRKKSVAQKNKTAEKQKELENNTSPSSSAEVNLITR